MARGRVCAAGHSAAQENCLPGPKVLAKDRAEDHELVKNRPWVPFSQGGDLDFMLGHKEPAPEFKVGSLVESPESVLQSGWEC